MNKAELVAHVADATGMAKDQAEKAITAMLAAIQKDLASGNQVTLSGFGSFSAVERAARTGRNPRTGEAIQLPARRLPHFKAGRSLKAAVSK